MVAAVQSAGMPDSQSTERTDDSADALAPSAGAASWETFGLPQAASARSAAPAIASGWERVVRMAIGALLVEKRGGGGPPGVRPRPPPNCKPGSRPELFHLETLRPGMEPSVGRLDHLPGGGPRRVRPTLGRDSGSSRRWRQGSVARGAAGECGQAWGTSVSARASSTWLAPGPHPLRRDAQGKAAPLPREAGHLQHAAHQLRQESRHRQADAPPCHRDLPPPPGRARTARRRRPSAPARCLAPAPGSRRTSWETIPRKTLLARLASSDC